MTDSAAENSETQTWLEFVLHCNYISKEIFDRLTEDSNKVGKLINYMIQNQDKFGSNYSPTAYSILNNGHS